MYEEECSECGGTGIIIACMDDICRNLGECIHLGGGEEICPECGGEGTVWIYPDDDEWDDEENEDFRL